MPSGVYKRTKESNRKRSEMLRGRSLDERGHRENCQCCVCKAKRGGSLSERGHSLTCLCGGCKAKRGEYRGLTKETDRRVASISMSLKGKDLSHRLGCHCRFCKNKRGEGSGWHHSKDAKLKIGKASREHWQNPEFVAKQMRARNVYPNKAEKFLDGLLQKFFSNRWRYVGDGQVIIAGKCPDFVNINGQKKIIELFGEPFHKPEEEQERISLFAQHGYQTLIIWYCELCDTEKLIEKIAGFEEIKNG